MAIWCITKRRICSSLTHSHSQQICTQQNLASTIEALSYHSAHLLGNFCLVTDIRITLRAMSSTRSIACCGTPHAQESRPQTLVPSHYIPQCNLQRPPSPMPPVNVTARRHVRTSSSIDTIQNQSRSCPNNTGIFSERSHRTAKVELFLPSLWPYVNRPCVSPMDVPTNAARSCVSRI